MRSRLTQRRLRRIAKSCWPDTMAAVPGLRGRSMLGMIPLPNIVDADFCAQFGERFVYFGISAPLQNYIQ